MFTRVFFSEGTVASKSEHKHEQGYKGFIFLLYLSRIGKKKQKKSRRTNGAEL